MRFNRPSISAGHVCTLFPRPRAPTPFPVDPLCLSAYSIAAISWQAYKQEVSSSSQRFSAFSAYKNRRFCLTPVFCHCPRERAVAALVVLAFPELSPVYQDLIEIHLNIPYCPGFLGFRQGLCTTG